MKLEQFVTMGDSDRSAFGLELLRRVGLSPDAAVEPAQTGSLGMLRWVLDSGLVVITVPSLEAEIGWSRRQLDRLVELAGGSDGIPGFEEMLEDVDRRVVQLPELVVSERFVGKRLGGDPVWQDATEVAELLSSEPGARLPTAEEWEALVRGPGSDDLFPWGDDLLDDYEMDVWVGDVPEGRVEAVTPLGLREVLWGEWTSSTWSGEYGGANYDGQAVVMGGGGRLWHWQNPGDLIWGCTSWRVPVGAFDERSAARLIWVPEY